MRRLSSRGVTLIELMITLVIMASLVMAAAPYLTDYLVNSRLREAGNALLAQTLYARSQAIKYNGQVTVRFEGSKVTVEGDGGDKQTKKSVVLPDNVKLSSSEDLKFNSYGQTVEPEKRTIRLMPSEGECGRSYRCPEVQVEAGGAVSLCKDSRVCERG